MNQYEQLKRPFKASKISWRAGAVSYHDKDTKKQPKSAIALAYIDARDVMERLDEVFGMNWQCKYSHAENKTICELSVLIDGVWITRSNGAGDSDVEAEKGAISDAFKRAGVMFGIGRYLYDLPNQWVEVDQYKKFSVTPLLPTGFYPVVTDKQAAEYVKQMLDETKSKEEKTAIYAQAKFDCEEAEDKDMWDFIKSAIQPKKEAK
jgi:hypothetical protein